MFEKPPILKQTAQHNSGQVAHVFSTAELVSSWLVCVAQKQRISANTGLERQRGRASSTTVGFSMGDRQQQQNVFKQLANNVSLLL